MNTDEKYANMVAGVEERYADVLWLAKNYMRKPGNETGGNLHIVLEDGNIEAGHVGWCLELCVRDDDLDGVRLARSLLWLNEPQRNRLWRELWK